MTIHSDDMYPFYWTSSERGIFMRYSYEFKRKCVEIYRTGMYPETPDGVSESSFRSKVRQWRRLEDLHGPEALKHKNLNKVWSPEEKLELVMQVRSGKAVQAVSIENRINDGMLHQWLRKYDVWGYNGLIDQKKGRKPKNLQMKKININNPRKLEESEYEELVRLRVEIEYIRAENEVIKKEIALREEKEAAQLKAKKQQLSKDSAKKDIN